MIYGRQVDLLLDCLPFVFRDKRIALKGGTALNLFAHDMPRLSVDIDITYLPIEDRSTTFANMHAILKQIKANLERNIGCKVSSSQKLDGKKEAKLIVARNGVEIKIEPNFTIRGAVFPAEQKELSARCTKAFGHEVEVPCLSRADLYGGKICAALDRQHPRDLFDMKVFFETGGFDHKVIEAFLFYLISHNRPFHELLNPNLKALEGEFHAEFSGMTDDEVQLETLEEARLHLIRTLRSELTEQDRNFLLGIAKGAPDWGLYEHPEVQNYPSVRWRIHNLDQMEDAKRLAQFHELEKILGS